MINYKQPRINKLISLFNRQGLMEDRFIPMWKKLSTSQLDRLIKKMENLK